MVKNWWFYNEKFVVVECYFGLILGLVMLDVGFFLWLDVFRWGDGVLLM